MIELLLNAALFGLGFGIGKYGVAGLVAKAKGFLSSEPRV